MKMIPLTPIRFHILLALAREDATATTITTRMAYDTFGEIDISAATLHDNLIAMRRNGWIIELPGRIYSLTEGGYERLQDDLYRWRIVTSRAVDTLRSRGSVVPG
jgi:DNA-binding PadR family transcriptional regulator